MIWNKEFETLSRESLENVQLERLRSVVERVYGAVPYYRQKMDDAGVKPTDINTLSDINRLPYTTKEDLRLNYPFGLFTVLKKSSGSTRLPELQVNQQLSVIQKMISKHGPS
jgi:phenylacetate-CoA ligase